MESLGGKVAIVTGANGLLGRETALALAGRGAEVIVTCRQARVGRALVADIKSKVPEAKVSAAKLDLGSPDSVREFAEDFKESGRPLHIFVANAGCGFTPDTRTPEGVPLLCQVNYLGHYTLTRLLEPVLISSAPSRIISVSSVTHRITSLQSVTDFLSRKECSRYQETKLAQIYFTYEAQKRLGHLGVNACAVDPGAVRTNIWTGDFGRPPFSWYVRYFMAPAAAGALAIVHAATVDFTNEESPKSRWPEANQRKDLRFYSKGTFTWPLMTFYEGPTPGLLGSLGCYIFFANLMALLSIDWPLYNLSGGRWLSKPRRTLSTRQSYDPAIAKELWNMSAEIAQLPANPQIPDRVAGRVHS